MAATQLLRYTVFTKEKECGQMSSAKQFLEECKTFYLATVEGTQPRVRPFGAVAEFEGKLYLCTNNKKPCFAQMKNNPRVEISGMAGERWIRLSGTLWQDVRDEARSAMLEQNPSLAGMYSIGDGIFEVLYFDSGEAAIHSFTAEPEAVPLV